MSLGIRGCMPIFDANNLTKRKFCDQCKCGPAESDKCIDFRGSGEIRVYFGGDWELKKIR